MNVRLVIFFGFVLAVALPPSLASILLTLLPARRESVPKSPLRIMQHIRGRVFFAPVRWPGSLRSPCRPERNRLCSKEILRSQAW